MEEIRALGGPQFDDIVAEPTPVVPLPLYTPQVRNRTSLRGFLEGDVYALKAKDVVKRTRVISADEMRDRLGLDSTQKLILLLFDDDDLLEAMWSRSAPMIWQLAEAAYDLIVAPSFSTYSPRPRTEFLINTRRSVLYFKALQRTGAPAVARIAWQVTHDSIRFAEWALANPCVRLVALDWSTYKSARDWRDQLEGLTVFDERTHGRLTYLINGVTTEDRAEALFRVVSPARARITNATTQARIPPARLRTTGDQTGATFSARCEVRRSVVERSAARLGLPHRNRLAA